MKNQFNSHYLIFLFATLFIYSCGGNAYEVSFDEPQPAGESNLSKIPKRLHGNYLNLSDSSTLVIDDKIMKRNYNYNYLILKDELDSTFLISGDTLFNQYGEKHVFRQYGDTLLVQINTTDTLFNLNYDNVMRKFMGYYFINNRLGETSWEVTKINLSNGFLKMSYVASEESIKTLQSITEANHDTIAPESYSVTKKQFKEFIKSNGFDIEETYIRLK
jgi:hypothetical protein